MADELIDIFDENNISLGYSVMKSEAHKTGLWHRAAHIWIYNSKGEILLQHRSKDKLIYPDTWDIGVAGHIASGEEPITSAIRETEEEIGLKIKENDFFFLEIRSTKVYINENMNNNEHNYVYLLKYEGNITDLKIQEEELQDIKWFKIEELKKELSILNPILQRFRFAGHNNYWTEMIKIIENNIK